MVPCLVCARNDEKDPENQGGRKPEYLVCQYIPRAPRKAPQAQLAAVPRGREEKSLTAYCLLGLRSRTERHPFSHLRSPLSLKKYDKKQEGLETMRRAKGGAGSPVAASETPSSSGRLPGGSGAVEGTRSATPSSAKLLLVVALVSTLYTALLVFGKGRGGTPTVDLRVASPSSGGAGGGGQATNLRRSFRKLSMMGFEEGSGQDGEWRTCREYEEGELGPHKAVRVRVYLPG